MIDSVQLVLFFVVVVLTVLLVILGVQVYLILKDLRKTITKANRVLDQAETITENVSAPLSTLASLTTNFKSGGSALTVLKMVKTFLSKDDEPTEKKRRD